MFSSQVRLFWPVDAFDEEYRETAEDVKQRGQKAWAKVRTVTGVLGGMPFVALLNELINCVQECLVWNGPQKQFQKTAGGLVEEASASLACSAQEKPKLKLELPKRRRTR